ncbi:MAG: YgjV family protein [Pseudomonadota bacterium]
MNDALGWVATAMFVSSYFFRKPALLRIAQMSGATLWIVYGVMIGAMPVIVANGLVFAAASWTMLRARQEPLAAT